MSEPVVVRVSGLPPRARVVIRANMQVVGSWRSRATFIADRRGEVRLDRQAPVEGPYTAIDPMGLFWTMEQEPLAPVSPEPGVRDPIPTSFEVEQDGRTLASATYTRVIAKPDVRITDVREDGLVGRLFEPAQPGPHPAILVLGGSEGGMDSWGASGLANRGYVALALAYFRRGAAESLPNELVNIPLEYFLKATDWLQRQPSVDPQRLAVYGGSRGSEAALLLASIAPQYRVVIARAPSSVSGAGVGRQNFDKPAWTYQGAPVPFASNELTVAQLRAGVDVDGGAIPIERSRAAVLLISGGADTISRPGASTLMGDLLIDRLKQARYPHPYMHLSYPEAGHTFGMFFLPGPILASGGGSPAANAKAGVDSTPKMFTFLQKNLNKAPRRKGRA